MATDIKKLLENMIGKAQSDQVRSAIKTAQRDLDAAGVARKAAEDTTTPSDGGADVTPAVLEAVDAAGATEVAATVKNVVDALTSLSALAPDVDMNALVAALVKAVAAPEAAEDAAPPEGDPAAMAGEMMKSLTDFIATSHKDMGDLARGYMEVAAALKTQTEQNAQLLKRVDALETKANGTPRIASKSAETVINPADKNHKEAESALKKSLGDETSFLGIAVRKS